MSQGYDGRKYRQTHLQCADQSNNFTFDEIFSISEDDVYKYVLKNGWDTRIVHFFDRLPDPQRGEEMFYDYIILPPENGRFQLAHFGSYDRQLWLRWNFGTQEEMFKFIIHELFDSQRGFWKDGRTSV